MTHVPKRPTRPPPPALSAGAALLRPNVPSPRHRAPSPVPFHRPTLVGTETTHVARAIREGDISGNGTYGRRCETWLTRALAGSADETEGPEVLLTSSCGSALELAAQLLKGDANHPGEVIVPSFAFVSTANAFVLHGFWPVFADVRVHDGNLDPESVAQAITPRTRAIVATHYAGVPCDMSALAALARTHGISLVEDASQALFSRHEGRPVGALGELGGLSFHSTKNISCGEGGALVVGSARHRERARLLREEGTKRARLMREDLDECPWLDRGGSLLPSELQAAYLFGQLERADRVQARRRALSERYRAGLAELEGAGHLLLPHPRPEVEINHHIQWILLASAEERTRLMAHLARRRIGARAHHAPLHLSPMGRRIGRGHGSLPVTERFGQCLLRLPLHAELNESEVDRVVDAIRAFFRVEAPVRNEPWVRPPLHSRSRRFASSK